MKGDVVTIVTNIGSPVGFKSKELYLFNPHGVVFAAAKHELIRLYTLV
jgi:hypothetical protein